MLYEPTQGSIHVDGKDLGLFNPYLWRDRIGVVSQDNFIFNETIDENIRFGKLDASDEEIVNACILSGAHSFIKELPSGYKTIVGERGYKLSGGERQRIALARALVRDPEILIFDEATSSLDSHSEWLIKKAIDDLHNTKTIIVVAHRLSTIVDADKIYVIEKGTPVETGTHEELLDLNKKYAFFWHFQTKKGCEIEENNNKKVDV
jgi:ATP-binding cassette subfamily B protein/subfamily B ATP-binding cassette protein MsbA